jgi:DNA adenine methylase
MAQPFVKFPGGKRDHSVITKIRSLVPKFCDQYVEPFVGGGAVFFALQIADLLQDKLVLLGDLDRDLVNLYIAIRKNPHSVHKVAQGEADHLASYDTIKEQKKSYNDLRGLWNLGEKKPGYQLFLRHAAFNGIFRVNSRGELNVPPRDKLDSVRIPPLPELLEAAAALEGAELLDWDFRQYEEQAFIGPGSLVYLDPPYDGEGGFRQYTRYGFTNKDQQDLIELAQTWTERGATVVYSNADTPLVKELLARYWPEATVDLINAKRTVSRDGDGRQPAPEVLAYVRPE